MKELREHSDGVFRDRPEVYATRMRITRLDVDGCPLHGPGDVIEVEGRISVTLPGPPEPPDPACILDPPLVVSGFEPYIPELPCGELGAAGVDDTP